MIFLGNGKWYLVCTGVTDKKVLTYLLKNADLSDDVTGVLEIVCSPQPDDASGGTHTRPFIDRRYSKGSMH